MKKLSPKFRDKLYAVGVLLFSVLTAASVFGLIEPVAASSMLSALTTFFGLFGVSLSGIAKANVSKQIEDGTFNPTPEVSPSDSVVNGLNAILEQKANAQREAERAVEAISGAVKDVPVLGSLADQILDQLKK